MSNSVYILTAVGIFVIAFTAVMLFKNENTYKNQIIISDALYAYNMDVIKHGRYDATISFDCIESYWKTMFKLWDWGYKHIVPPEMFELIKPYINK